MLRDPASATSETYELKVQTFKNGKPEESHQIMKDFKTGIDGTGTNSASGEIQFLCTLFCGEALREFDFITNQVGNTTNLHLRQIKEGLLRYLFPINALNNKKRAMRRAMTKPQDL